jgi:hypothetical protein
MFGNLITNWSESWICIGNQKTTSLSGALVWKVRHLNSKQALSKVNKQLYTYFWGTLCIFTSRSFNDALSISVYIAYNDDMVTVEVDGTWKEAVVA